jgi:hypothetical protein
MEQAVEGERGVKDRLAKHRLFANNPQLVQSPFFSSDSGVFVPPITLK